MDISLGTKRGHFISECGNLPLFPKDIFHFTGRPLVALRSFVVYRSTVHS